jgi:hypothetical protein
VDVSLWVFVCAFLFASLSGVASVLRASAKPTLWAVLSSALNSGMLGLGLSLLWIAYFRDNVHFLVGICVLAGLGGVSTVELALAIFRKKIAPDEEKKNGP